MSVDIQIIPAVNRTFTWLELRTQIILDLTSYDHTDILALFGQEPKLVLLKRGDRRIVKEEERILPPGLYSFYLAGNNTLTLSCRYNDISADIEPEYMQAYFEDYGKNLDWKSFVHIYRIWSEIGYSYTFTSYGGRALGELTLLASMVRSVAKLTSGWVVVKDSEVVSLSRGIYTFDELS